MMSSNIARDLATSMFAIAMVPSPYGEIRHAAFTAASIEVWCSTVWGPEIIDHKLPQCTRVENERLGTVDFLMLNGSVLPHSVA